MPPRPRLAIALAAGLAGALLTAWSAAHAEPGTVGDFDYIWVAARALLHGQDPYAAVVAFGYPFPLYYPLPAVLVATPAALLPLVWARALWAGAAAFTVAYLLPTRGRWAYWTLLHPAFLVALVVGQWSPWLLALVLVPATMRGGWFLQGLLCLKPSIGPALWMLRPSPRVALAVVLVLLASVAIYPPWPALWLAAIRGSYVQVAPVAVPGGALLLLAWTRWRRPEARFLGTLALIPHTIAFYDTLLLAPIARTRRELLWLITFAVGGEVLGRWLAADLVRSSPEFFAAFRRAFVWACYLPSLALVLRRPHPVVIEVGVPSPDDEDLAARRAGAPAHAVPEGDVTA